MGSSISSLAHQPLADRLRPTTLDCVVGQQHLVGQGKPLRTLLEQEKVHSMVFWGPPGTGKTTLARIVAKSTNAEFIALSAVLCGVKDIRAAVAIAADRLKANLGTTVLFVDEVHRFNKAQQDAFLPHIEDGTIIFIGATTENPSFELNNALLSRLRVYTLTALKPEDLLPLLDRALEDVDLGLGAQNLQISQEAKMTLVNYSDGDARRLLTLLEIASDLSEQGRIDNEQMQSILQGAGHRRFDKGGDAFYDQISALHKSVRGSDPDAALYWLCRLIDGGCDPKYIARRLIRIASEDIGNADPRALAITLDAWQTQERLGSPEGELSLAQAVIYLAVAAKSNAVYVAYKQAMQTVKDSGSLDVPMHLRNAPTPLMNELGHGKDYRYAHDEPDAVAVGETYFPEKLIGTKFYEPVERGLEIKIKEKLEYLRGLSK